MIEVARAILNCAGVTMKYISMKLVNENSKLCKSNSEIQEALYFATELNGWQLYPMMTINGVFVLGMPLTKSMKIIALEETDEE